MEISKWHQLLNEMFLMRRSKTKLAVAAAAACIGSFYTFDYARSFLLSTLHANVREKTEDGLLSIRKSKALPEESFVSFRAETVDQRLRKQEFTWKNVNHPGPVLWFETNHINANNPIEDRHSECFLHSNQAYFFGIYDGHSGWHCSETLRKRLPYYIATCTGSREARKDWVRKEICDKAVEYLGNSLDDCPTFTFSQLFDDKQARLKTGHVALAEKLNLVPDLSVSHALKMAYASMDSDISKEAIPDGIFNDSLLAGISGAVSVGAFIHGNEIYVVNTGDCRAVLGSKSASGSWMDTPLSEDHTAQNTREVERLNKEHPGERSTLIVQSRLLGQLMPLRSFGDVQYKWSRKLHEDVLKVVYGGAVVPAHMYQTPPYLTAEPEVTLKKLDMHDHFIILATDGMWDTVSNQQAVQIVGRYLDELSAGKVPKENAATQLMRYALGQGSDAAVAEMLSIPSREKRNYHDDITVTVVFFNTKTAQLKAKL